MKRRKVETEEGWELLSSQHWEPVDDAVEVLKAAKCYNDSEPLAESIKRLAAERDTERARAESARLGSLELRKKISSLESEVFRLTAPKGAAIAYTPNGPKTCGQSFSAPPPPPASVPDPTRARCGRQRRELRRLNQSQLLLKLQLERQETVCESLMRELLNARDALRVAELKK